MRNGNERKVEGICRRWMPVEGQSRMFCTMGIVSRTMEQ